MVSDPEFAERTEPHRRELRVHCYRMLASFEDAEDAVQETLLRAWRRQADLADVEYVRAWLYKIATNACLDTIRAKKRRLSTVESFRDVPWLEPFPDRLLDLPAPTSDQPDVAVVGREAIELAFLAVIQLLPPRQRAVLIMRQVLDWPAAEVAEVLDIGVAAVNSSLQRARATLREHLPAQDRDSWSARYPTETERAVLAQYMAAHESGDTLAALALIRDDIRVTMPPAPYLFEGRAAVIELLDRAAATGEWRLIATSANRQPAAACYLRARGESAFTAFKIDVLRVVDGAIAEATTFGPQHFAAFGLDTVLP
jgi:RNA polymerase sigma-70 factor (TIGR02960 family)